MPRGFLVKRTNKSIAHSYRIRRNSEEDRSDSGSEHELSPVYTRYGTPDSGFVYSPVSVVTAKENELKFKYDQPQNQNDNRFKYESDSAYSTPTGSPRHLAVSANTIGSPFYFSTFDRLSVSSGSPTLQSRFLNSESPNPQSPSKRRTPDHDADVKPKSPKKPKAARKIDFAEKSSVASSSSQDDPEATETRLPDGGRLVKGDIDSSLNFVEVTPEAQAELEKIENKIGDFICQLCKDYFEDAFKLAQHKCSRILHIEYRCPECDKVFNCPANLASHRRWHKPRPNKNNTTTQPAKLLPAIAKVCADTANNNTVTNANENNLVTVNNADLRNADSPIELNGNDSVIIRPPHVAPVSPSHKTEGLFECPQCTKKFRRQAYLRKHIANHSADDKPHPCQLCSKVFKSQGALLKHVACHRTGPSGDATQDDQHDTPKEHVCSVCSNTFQNKAALERHLRTHSNQTFPCKYCDSMFYSSPGLTRHINKCHPSENRQVILLQVPVNRTC